MQTVEVLINAAPRNRFGWLLGGTVGGGFALSFWSQKKTLVAEAKEEQTKIETKTTE